MDSVEADRDKIAGRALGEILTEIPAYAERDSQPLREEVFDNARRSLDLFITLVREDRDAAPGELDFVSRTVSGPLRRSLGVEAILRAYRIGHRATWDVIVRRTEGFPNGSDISVALSRPAMEFIDSISNAVAIAFFREHETLEAESATESRDLVESLIDGSDPEPSTPAGRAAISALHGPTGFLTLRGRITGDPESGSARRLARMLSRMPLGHGGLVSVRQREVVAFLPLRDHSPRDAAQRLPELTTRFQGGSGPSVRIGLSLECMGLAESARGYAEAGEALRMSTDHQPIVALPLISTFEQLLARTDDTLRRQARASLGELGKRTDPAGEDLRQTVLTYASNGMNARATAEALICHPNTVHHRLARIEQLSGLDPTNFHDLVDLVTAVRIR